MKLTIEQALQQGIAAHKEGKIQEAERLYRIILQSQPLHPDANHNLGVLAVSLNKIDIALPLIKTAIESNPKIEQYWLSYIDALIKEKQFDNARQVLERAKKEFEDLDRLNSKEELLMQLTQAPKSKLPAQSKSLSFSEKRKKMAEQKKKKKKKKLRKQNLKSITSPPKKLLNRLLGHYQNKRFSEAKELAEEITQDFPKHEFAWKILGAVLRAKGRKSEAVDANQVVVELFPQDATAHSNLGITLKELGRLEDAESSYNQAIALNSDFSETKHMLAALHGKTTTTAPRDYIEDLFDNYAAKFDVSLVNNLEYKMPRLISEMIIKESKFDSLGSIMDLGCGTGLFGKEIKQYCENLEGIDLSERMLDKAKEKNVYNKLIKQDIITYLSNENFNFDYFISADVFIYIGDLSDVFRLIKSRNKTGGKLAFSTEDLSGEGFFLEQSGRYSHSKNYIEGLCEQFGYKLIHYENQLLRKEKNQDISGGLYLLDF